MSPSVFALDPSTEQPTQIVRLFGDYRFAFNWALVEIRADLE